MRYISFILISSLFFLTSCNGDQIMREKQSKKLCNGLIEYSSVTGSDVSKIVGIEEECVKIVSAESDCKPSRMLDSAVEIESCIQKLFAENKSTKDLKQDMDICAPKDSTPGWDCLQNVYTVLAAKSVKQIY